MTADRLAEARARHAAATEGPWWFDESDTCWRLHGVAGRIPPQLDGLIPEQIVNKQILKAPKRDTQHMEYWPDAADSAFIAHAWKDLRDAFAEVDRLTVELAKADNVFNSFTSCRDCADHLDREHTAEYRAARAEAERDEALARLAALKARARSRSEELLKARDARPSDDRARRLAFERAAHEVRQLVTD